MAARQVLEPVKEDVYRSDYFTLERGGELRKCMISVHTPKHCSSSSDSEDDRELRIVLVGNDCASNKELLHTAKKLSPIAVETSGDGLEFVQAASAQETLFVLSDFEGEVYHKLHRAEARIIGPPVILSCKRDNQVLPYSTRPLYCTSMQRVVVCFTGFKQRDQLCHLVDLVHHMGGSVRKDMTPKVTHLVANCTGGDKYKYAMTMGMPIMSEEWVHQLWEQRDNLDIASDSEAMMLYKVKPFFQCRLSFLGFSPEEQKHMEDLTIENGGTYTSVGSEEATHLVVDEHAVKELPPGLHIPELIVRGEWFWGCIQMAACAEEGLYLYQRTFKEQIEKPDQYNGAILALQDIKTIFGNIPPIYDIHRKLKEDLARLVENWSEDASVGEIIIKHDALTKAYPNFVNYFENTKETIIKHINEDKRKTEGQMVMFDIVNDIDNCPESFLAQVKGEELHVNTRELSRLSKAAK
nr:hypothetical protein BaRGS_021148 [Batillaria attramentaria]